LIISRWSICEILRYLHPPPQMDALYQILSFNLLIQKDDGQLAWTVAPVTVDDLCMNFATDTSAEQQLETQSKPCDLDLFQAHEHNVSRVSFAPSDMTELHRNKGTVRIYSRSVRLSSFPAKDTSVKPSIITVERAALCQIFLETKYHKTFHEPSEREIRRQTLQSLVSKGKELLPEQKDKVNQLLNSLESEWARLSRVRPSANAFEIGEKLGSGGFGVVHMVKEKDTGTVYAMKVHPSRRKLNVVYF